MVGPACQKQTTSPFWGSLVDQVFPARRAAPAVGGPKHVGFFGAG
jgi:hypothetical protein